MKSRDHIFTSLTRISDLRDQDLEIKKLPKDQWANADYVSLVITHPGKDAKIELDNGRQTDPLRGEKLIGALGARFATLEATGTWEQASPDEEMELLTAAGLTGKMTSTSPMAPTPMRVKYLGHVMVNGEKCNMADYVQKTDHAEFKTPVILMTGTSMSAGKTTVARVVTNELVKMGHRVLGAKLTGAGRYRDILAMRDAGASDIIDFVDGGIPSSIVSAEVYEEALEVMLSRMGKIPADIAVVEIGASPFEPYNGALAIKRIRENIKYKVICTADPYAVYGVIKGFDFVPDLVSGPCTNTLASRDLVEKLTGVEALNLLDMSNRRVLRDRLKDLL